MGPPGRLTSIPTPSYGPFLRRALLNTAIITSAIYVLIAMANIAAFIRAPQIAKPGARMPAYPQLSEQEAIAERGRQLTSTIAGVPGLARAMAA